MKTETALNHTPYVVTENWKGDKILHGELPVVRFRGCDAIIASLGAPKFECEQIAHLVAAAPDMLAALEFILDHLYDPQKPMIQGKIYSDTLAPTDREKTVRRWLIELVSKAKGK